MNYINQAPKDFAQQSAAFRKKFASTDELMDDGRWIIQPKYDGVHVMIHTEGEGYARTRTGEAVLSVPHLIKEAIQSFGPGAVLFCEAYMPDKEHASINGAVRRKSQQPALIGIVYDVVTQDGFDYGYDPIPYKERLADINTALRGGSLEPVKCIEELPNGTTVMQFAEDMVASGTFDGIILRDLDATWKRGAAKDGEVIKVKPILSLDLLVTGHKVEYKPTKLGGYITVTYRGVESNVGSGLTQVILQALTQGVKAAGRIAEVECMGITPSGKLREPRFKSFRYDTEQEEMKG